MLAVQALVDAGDEVVAVTPVWPNLTAQPLIMGADLRRVSLQPVAGAWKLDLAGAAGRHHAGHQAADRQRAEQPHRLDADARRAAGHPGALPQDRHLDPGRRGLRAAVLRAHGARCAPSFLDVAGPDDRLVVAHSFSKSFLMTGWRLGWLVMPAGHDAPHGQAHRVQHLLRQRVHPARRAGGDQRTDEVTPRVVAHLKTCRDTLVPLLQALPGVQWRRPRAACTPSSSWKTRASATRWRWPSGWWPRPGWASRPATPSRPRPRAGCAGASPVQGPGRLGQGVDRLATWLERQPKALRG
jgi:hypothetical protein